MSSTLLTRSAALLSIASLLAAPVAHAGHPSPENTGICPAHGTSYAEHRHDDDDRDFDREVNVYGGYGFGYGAGYGNAYGNAYGYRQRTVSLGFERLEARLYRGKLLVNFRLQRESFRMMQRMELFPVLRLDRRGNTFVEAPISTREGTLVFDLPRHGAPREIVVSVAGGNRRVTIDSLWLDGAPATRVTLAVFRPAYGNGYGRWTAQSYPWY